MDISGLTDKVCEMGVEIAKSIPFAGTAITAIEGLISIVWVTYKDLLVE